MGIIRFSPRAMKFLEIYFGGALMKDAARAAGYRGTSDQALCNTGRAILDKFSKIPFDLFLPGWSTGEEDFKTHFRNGGQCQVRDTTIKSSEDLI